MKIKIKMFIPQFGNLKHIEAVKQYAKLEALKVELKYCQAGAKKVTRLKNDIELLERNIKELIR
jgi:hypothetical protein